MELNIKTPEDILEFMKANIKYGWLDINNEEHVGNMKNFRRLYKVSSLDEVLEHGLGCCIEQVYLMKQFLDAIGLENKMFCTRVYEPNDFNDLDADERMHCFILYYLDGMVHQIEHPNFERVGIYHYNSEEEAIKEINKIYEEMSGGIARPVTEFYEAPAGMSFKEFNAYINNLDIEEKKFKNKA